MRFDVVEVYGLADAAHLCKVSNVKSKVSNVIFCKLVCLDVVEVCGLAGAVHLCKVSNVMSKVRDIMCCKVVCLDVVEVCSLAGAAHLCEVSNVMSKGARHQRDYRLLPLQNTLCYNTWHY